MAGGARQPRAPSVRKVDLDRALKAMKDAGLEPDRIEVRPGGGVVIIPRSLTDPLPSSQRDGLDEWRDQKRARRAAQGT